MKEERKLGEGHFGIVTRNCIFLKNEKELNVAVKKVKIKKPNDEKKLEEFDLEVAKKQAKKEMEIELNFMHYLNAKSNELKCYTGSIIRMLASTTDRTMMVLELCTIGCAKTLRNILLDQHKCIPEKEIVNFGTQIMKACEFLCQIGVAHNDWACRNVLVSKGGIYIYKVLLFILES